jgi:hypothetical protein
LTGKPRKALLQQNLVTLQGPCQYECSVEDTTETTAATKQGERPAMNDQTSSDCASTIQPAGEDAAKFVGTWKLVAITTDGRITPWRGANPTGLITYHQSGWMAAQIQPDRPPVDMAGKEPSGEEALQALHGYTAYFGTYSVDETAKIVTHHRRGSVSPGWQDRPDFRRTYLFDGTDRIVLHPVGNRNELIWERLK